MSALITIDSEDPELKIMLGLLIAKAIQDAGFTNARAKTIMMSSAIKEKRDVPAQRANILINDVLPVRHPPELRDINYSIYHDHEKVMAEMKERNQSLVDKPVVLSFFDDTGDKYEQQVKEFLQFLE